MEPSGCFYLVETVAAATLEREISAVYQVQCLLTESLFWRPTPVSLSWSSTSVRHVVAICIYDIIERSNDRLVFR